LFDLATFRRINAEVLAPSKYIQELVNVPFPYQAPLAFKHIGRGRREKTRRHSPDSVNLDVEPSSADAFDEVQGALGIHAGCTVRLLAGACAARELVHEPFHLGQRGPIPPRSPRKAFTSEC
jgi:hypothetical protein